MSYINCIQAIKPKVQTLAAIAIIVIVWGVTTYDYSGIWGQQDDKTAVIQSNTATSGQQQQQQQSAVVRRSVSGGDAETPQIGASLGALSSAAMLYRQEGISPAEIETMIKFLKLNDDQTALVNAMYEGYRMGTDEGASQTRELRSLEMQGVTPAINNDPQSQEKLIEAMKKRQEAQAQWRAERKQLEKQFFNDVQLILDDKQAQAWPKYQQNYRRRSTLKKSAQIPGEGIDLIDLIEKLELSSSETEMLKPSLDKYAEELDRALGVRNQAIANLSDKSGFMVTGDNKNPDPESMFDMNNKVTEKRYVLVEINNRYVRTLASAMGSTSSQKLIEEFDRSSFPGIFRPTQADRYIEDVKALPDLTADQQLWIEDIVQKYQADINDINNQLVTLERKKQDEQAHPKTNKDDSEGGEGGGGVRIAMMTTTGDGNIIMSDDNSSEYQDEIYDTQTRKYEIVINTIDDIYAILADNQRAEHDKPKVRKPSKGMFSFMNDMQIEMPGMEGGVMGDVVFEAIELELGDILDNIDFEALNGDGVQVSVQKVINADGEVEQEVNIETTDTGSQEDSSEDDK